MIFKGKPAVKTLGGLAQLGEHLLCKQGVNGSIPLASTRIPVVHAVPVVEVAVKELSNLSPLPHMVRQRDLCLVF